MSGFGRFICRNCTKKLKAKTYCQSAECPRCTSMCALEEIGETEKKPELEKILNRRLGAEVRSMEFVRAFERKRQQDGDHQNS